MSSVDPAGDRDGHAGDLISAHVDGELDAATDAWVRDHLAGCAPCRAASAEAVAARDWVRGLPGVDSTSLVESLLARHRSTVRVGAAFVGMAAVVLGALALSASAIRAEVVVDIDGFVAAHVATAPTSGASSDARSGVATAVGIEAMGEVRRVDSVGRPYSAPPAMIGNRASLSRNAIFDGHDLAVVAYSDGESSVSVFQQPGILRWDLLPEGRIETVGLRRVWVLVGPAVAPTVMVAEAGDVVFTVVADDRGAAVTVIDGLPDRDRSSTWERVHDSCSRLTEVFALGG